MARKGLFGRKKSPDAPSWLITYADLMSLLLCFFVLLLSFSEMDRKKFKILSGSLKEAFGIQRTQPFWEVPKGIDIISQEFNDPSLVDKVMIEDIRQAIRLFKLEGKIRIRQDAENVTISFPDQILFESGSAQLKEAADPVLDRFREIIQKYPYRVMVVGHTDDVPIATPQFPSNWELSAARAGSVIRHLLQASQLDPGRFIAVGKADTVPVKPNDSPAHRAENRRVEIVFQKKTMIRPVSRLLREALAERSPPSESQAAP